MEASAFERDLKEIEPMFAFIRSFGARHAIEEDVVMSMCLAVEEFFTNILKYNPSGRGLIGLEAALLDRQLKIVITDPDAPQFDPTALGPVPIHQDLANRLVGGLGIHLAGRSVDEVSYEHDGRQSRITMIKHTE